MEKLDIYTFGRQLITTSDLDPVYTVLCHADLEREVLCNWLLAYWCFYHMGTASWIADTKTHKAYWERMHEAAATKAFPRGTERRHFRGTQATKAVFELSETARKCHISPFAIIDMLAWGETDLASRGIRDNFPTLSEVMARVKQLRGFGDWIAFKVADMLERLGFAPIQFEPGDIFLMFESPRDGAVLMAEKHNVPHKEGDARVYSWAYSTLHRKLGLLKAPPRNERRINIQEIETILCKWKSHMNGHYYVGKDTHEVKEALELFQNRAGIAKQLLQAGKQGELW